MAAGHMSMKYGFQDGKKYRGRRWRKLEAEEKYDSANGVVFLLWQSADYQFMAKNFMADLSSGIVVA
ncbi:hypothetical protein AgCh_025618 [Apium graveolens]